MKLKPFFSFCGLLLAGLGSATVLNLGIKQLPVGKNARLAVVRAADRMVNDFQRNAYLAAEPTILQRQKEGLWKPGIPLLLPVVVRVYGGHMNPFGSSGPGGFQIQHHILGGGGGLSGGGGIHHFNGSPLVLQFDASGSEAFPTAYQQLLQNVFNQVQPTLNLLFGPPAQGGNVHVANFDATIGDRQAVAGGYYLPNNGNGVPEIRFPVYNANETAAVNFVHCLLLAYLGPDGYSTDAFEEGLVRAVTIRAVRTAGALPSGLDPTALENVLEADYDVLGFYDWNNQRSLSAKQFIAPNLINSPLPASGGTGLFLTRYMMAGSAWAKVLTEYPTFAASLNQQVYNTPSLGSNIPGLITAGQSILAAAQPSSPTVEGYSLSDWYNRQFVLQPTPVFGTRLFEQILPISPSTGDFAVFDIDGTLFNTDALGNENLLSSITGYPIFWDDQFQRFTTSAQDAQMSFSNGSGNVEPNFPNLYNGQPYRATLDLPVLDQLCRVMVPANAAYTSTGTANDFYGTTAGVTLNTGDTLNVIASIGGTTVGTFPVTNDAFGGIIGSNAGYLNGNVSVTLTLVKSTNGVNTTLMTRKVDKQGPGALAVYLNVSSEQSYQFQNGLPAGISMFGLPIDPYTSDAATILGTNPLSTLLARYDATTVSYDFYPAVEPLQSGHSFFADLSSSIPNFTLTGRDLVGTSRTIALKPGWNMVSLPMMSTLQTTSVRVVHATDFPVDFASAQGTLIGKDYFFFSPGSNDPISGNPQSGTFNQASEFDPGVGYFVECLAPEGVVLVFDPGSNQFAPHQNAPSQSGWLIKTIFTNFDGHTTGNILGGIVGASNGFSNAFDTPLPPSLGVGFQSASLNSGGKLFRDERAYGQTQVFSLMLTGLTPGQPFTLNFAGLQGNVRSFFVTDEQAGKVYTCFLNSKLTFTAVNPTESFVINISGH